MTSPPTAGDPYKNPELFRFVGSMEGVPDWVDATETADELSARAHWQARAHHLFNLAGTLLPGVVLAGLVAVLGTRLAEWLGSALFHLASTPVSPILCAIALGFAIRNSVGLPTVYELGTQLCLKRVLRLGVALLGIRLGIAELGAIGLAAVPIVLATIAVALLLVTNVSRALGLPPRLGTLVAVGTAICGNTAIVATGPVIGANEDEVSYAVGCITVFGLFALVGYPFVANAIFGARSRRSGSVPGHRHPRHRAGGRRGAALRAGVRVARGARDRDRDEARAQPVHARRDPAGRDAAPRGAGARTTRPKLGQLVPGFVLGFAALALVRSIGDAGSAPFGGLISRAPGRSSPRVCRGPRPHVSRSRWRAWVWAPPSSGCGGSGCARSRWGSRRRSPSAGSAPS